MTATVVAAVLGVPAALLALSASPQHPPSTRLVARAEAAPTRLVVHTRLADGATYRGVATWYGPGFEGRPTASGERFHTDAGMTAAHRWLPFGTQVRVCTSRRCVVVRINDRGPFGRGRIVDLSRLAARRLGIHYAGRADVTVTVLRPYQVAVRVPVAPPRAAPARAPAPGSRGRTSAALVLGGVVVCAACRNTRCRSIVARPTALPS